MNADKKKMTKADRKKLAARIVCLALAVIMVGSALMAAIMSQVY